MRRTRTAPLVIERLSGLLACAAVCAALQGCVSVAVEEKADNGQRIEQPELAVRWVTDSAEYRALTLQVFRNADAVLDELVADPRWTALPGQPADPSLPPAIILDVDETVLDNSPFQVLLGDKPFNRGDWDQWVARADAEPLPGAVEFIARAQAAGVQVFLVTNRDCMRRADSREACPQEADTLANLRRVGVSTDAEHLLLSNERPEWTDEKMVRRQFLARYYRVIMVFGDDLGDFLDCARARVIPPCTRPATAADRLRAISEYEEYWGRGWFVLPNPMYGSWTSVR